MIAAFIKGQAIEVEEPIIVAESLNYLKAQFVFITSDWNGLEKTAYFTHCKESHPIKLDENNVAFPLHLSAGEWAVSVVGREYYNGKLVERITTDAATISVKPFKTGAETPFPEPIPTEIEALKAEIGKLSDLATSDKTSVVNAINEICLKGGSGGGKGEDGFSPIVDVTKIEGGHRVTITDAEGEKSFDVLNGKDTPGKIEYVTPQMFGAVGDGTTDDTVAFQSAVDSGKPLFIPSGEYKVGNVYIANPITIKGGNYPRLKFPVEGYRVGEAYKYQPLSIFYCKGGTTEGADGVNGVIIEGIHFDGNCKAICETYYEAEGLISPVLMANIPTHSEGVLIRDRSKNITIRDCRFDDFKDAAVAIEKCSKQVTVENCIIGEEGWHGYGYNKGIVASLSQYGGSAEIEDISGYFIFRNNRIFNCGEHGINVYSSYNHCVIEGNFVKDCGLMYDNPDPEIEGGTLTWGYCIKTSGGADLLVANNTCISGMSNGIGLMGDIDHGNKGEMRIIGNHIIGGDDEHSKSSGIQCENVVGVIISDNIIENIHIHAYAGVYAIRTSCGSLISNNIIKNCDRGIGINVYGDTPEYSEAPNTHICDNTIIASQPLTLNKLNGANISNNYIKGTEGIDTIVDENVAGIILSDGETVNLNNNILTDLPLGIKAAEMKNVVIIETMFSNVDNEYDIDVDTNINVVVRENKVSSSYELIEEKTITYDDLTVTTSQPSNWATNYKAYCTFDGSSYIPITDSTAPVWEANKYYLNGVQRVNRTFTTDKYSKMILVCSVSDKAPVTNAVYIGFTCDNISKELYFNSGVTAGEKRYFYASADVSEGLLMPVGSTPKADSTSSNLHGTPTPVPVSSKISRVLVANYGSGLPVGTTISFYGIK